MSQNAVVGQPVPGYLGRVVIGGLILNMTKFSWNGSAKLLDVVSFESTGPDGQQYQDDIPAKRMAEWSFEGYWDASIPPHGPVPNISEGAVVAGLQFFVDKTVGTRNYTCGLSIFEKVSCDNDAAGLAGIKASGRSKGYYTRAA
jgi:hypothetical protein